MRRLSALGLLVIAAAALAVQRTEAAFPGENGLIAYEADGSICVMGADGSRSRRVTYSRFRDSSPAWAPEGRRLSFASTRRSFDGSSSDPYDIFVYDRRSLTDITSVEYPRDLNSAWSPDGNQVAVDFAERFGSVPFSIMNSDGTNRRIVAPGDEPAWSPDGQWIAYFSDVPTEVGPAGLYVIRPDGSGKRRIGSGSSPSWSPDGSEIAFAVLSSSAHGIFVVRPDGTDLRQVTTVPTWQYDWGPEWSPDGRQIVFWRSPPSDIFVVAPDGNGLRNLTNTPRVTEYAPSWQRRPESEQFELPRGARGCGRKIVDSDIEPEPDSRLDGGQLDDLVYAAGDNDRVRGRGGSDVLFGEEGDDVVLGGPGRDDLRGGPGNDVLGARDRTPDEIRCGPGRDRVVADRRDRVSRDCERISRR